MTSEKLVGARAHYFKDVSNIAVIDVYRVLMLWEISDPAVQHAVKKLLAAGKRGSKTFRQDIAEAVETLQRRLEIYDEDHGEHTTQLASTKGAASVAFGGYQTEAFVADPEVFLGDAGKLVPPTEPTENGKIGSRAGYSEKHGDWVCAAADMTDEQLAQFKAAFPDVQLTHYWAETSRSWVRDVFNDYKAKAVRSDQDTSAVRAASLPEFSATADDMTRQALDAVTAQAEAKSCLGCKHYASADPRVTRLCEVCAHVAEKPWYIAAAPAQSSHSEIGGPAKNG